MAADQEGILINIINSRKRYILLVLMLILLAVLLFAYYHYRLQPAGEEKIVVFILDRMTDSQRPISHGELVRRVIERQAGKAEIIPIDITAEDGRISEDYYLNGLLRIVNYRRHNPEAKILVNISLAFQNGKSQREYIKELNKQNVLMVAAAGNEASEIVLYPAGFPEVIAVAASRAGKKAEESNYGEYVDLTASGDIEYIDRVFFPGQNLSRRYRFSGTSFAAPRVVGLIAAILHRGSDMSIEEAVKLVKDTAQSFSDPLYEEGKLGAGIIDSATALRRADDNSWTGWLRPAIFTLITSICLLLLWPKFGYYSIFVLTMLILVVTPLIYLITNFLKLQIPILLLFFIMYPILLKISGFSRMIVTAIWLGLMIFMNFKSFSLPGSIIITAATGISVLAVEYIIYYWLQHTDNYRLLLAGLCSDSGKIRRAARRQLKTIYGKEQNRILASFLRSDNKQQQKELLDLVLSQPLPPVKVLLEYGSRKRELKSKIIDEVLEMVDEDQLLASARELLQRKSREIVEVGRDVLSRLSPAVIVPAVEEMLEQEEKYNPQIVLEIAAVAGSSGKELIPRVVSILKSNAGMWVRYQAVRTLVHLLEDEQRLREILQDHINDRDQLVAMEVREVLKKGE